MKEQEAGSATFTAICTTSNVPHLTSYRGVVKAVHTADVLFQPCAREIDHGTFAFEVKTWDADIAYAGRIDCIIDLLAHALHCQDDGISPDRWEGIKEGS